MPMSWVGKNLRWYMDTLGMTEPRAAATLGLSQSTINRLINQSSSRPNRDPSQSTIQKLARGMGVSADALMTQDLSEIYADGAIFTEYPDGRGELSLPAALPAPQSQPVLPDLDRLGVALTAIDKALRDVEVQGRMGTLAEAVRFAYLETFSVEDIHDRAQLALYDRIVATHLRDWGSHGQTEGRDAEAGAGQHSEAAAPRASHGRGR